MNAEDMNMLTNFSEMAIRRLEEKHQPSVRVCVSSILYLRLCLIVSCSLFLAPRWGAKAFQSLQMIQLEQFKATKQACLIH